MRAIDIASAFICLYSKNHTITNLKLNKLVYLAYARYLHRGNKLFFDEVQAWKYGPVVPNVYQAFKSSGKNPITTAPVDVFSSDVIDVVRDVWQDFGNLGAFDLMELTHKKGSAWYKVYKDNQNAPITDAVILSTNDGLTPDYTNTLTAISDQVLRDFKGVFELLTNA